MRNTPFFISWFTEGLPNLFDRTLENAPSPVLRVLIFLILFLSVPLIITPLEIWQQGAIALLFIIIGLLVVQIENQQQNKQTSEYLHLFLIWLSLVTTLRYLYYRTSYTLNFNNIPNGIACVLLYGAELYAILTLVLAYFQTLKIQDRESIDLSQFPQEQWFTVDVYIPTYNEDVEIVRKTVLAALALDYPADKKRVYVLDDGRAEKYKARREHLRQVCEELGCTMLTRDNNEHAKAGNINTAFRNTDGDLVLILDCDHIPTRNILKTTVGFFFDPKVAFVQTPHWFYNPDPFERNLLTKGKIPVGNELFYKILQKGNDFWNAAFFCGSAAIIRKKYALEVGGIAVETVTEDCHTAFRLHSLGYKSVYYDKIMVAGLAPETFSSYVGQQVRWARGMAQILRLENPVLNPKLNLTIPQRICYFSATSHFFYGFPRLVYAIAPTLYLLFGINPIQGLGVETLFYALPHILLSLNANYITYKEVRYTFWNEIFEFAMSYQAGIVTLMALINPKLGSFNVTDKGVLVTKRSFDWQSSQILLGVAGLVVLSLIAVPFWLILRPEEKEAVFVNALWSIFNLLLLVASIIVALEQPQMRRTHRMERELGATIYSEGQAWTGKTANISETGAQIILNAWPNLPDEVEVELVGDYGKKVALKARIVRNLPMNETQSVIAVDFLDITPQQNDDLTLVIFSDVREWFSQTREELDDPLGSLGFLATGFLRAFRALKPAPTGQTRKRIRAAVQLFWEGQYYPGQATEMGVRSLRVELDATALSQLETWQRIKPPVGLLLSPKADDSNPTRLLALVQSIQTLPARDYPMALELTFPEPIRQRQENKIQQAMKKLGVG
jgi:cellulose synthase (UDP-forming)